MGKKKIGDIIVNIINKDFKHGKNFKIGYFCVIEEDVVVGDNVIIENHVLLKKGTRIGNKCFIDSYVRSSGKNNIGIGCTIRYGATIAKDVYIHKNVFISPNVMTIFSDPSGKSKGSTIIGAHSFIGTAAVINSGIIINDNVIVGAMSYVNKDCEIENGIYIGQPAKLVEVRN